MKDQYKAGPYLLELVAQRNELLGALKDFENVFLATERANAGLKDFAVCDLEDARARARSILSRVAATDMD